MTAPQQTGAPCFSTSFPYPITLLPPFCSRSIFPSARRMPKKKYTRSGPKFVRVVRERLRHKLSCSQVDQGPGRTGLTKFVWLYQNLDKICLRTHWTDKICLALPKILTKFVSAKFSIWVRTHWTDKICFTLPKFSTKFVPAKFSICQAWAHRYTAKYLLTTSFNHTEINTIACSLFAGKVT